MADIPDHPVVPGVSKDVVDGQRQSRPRRGQRPDVPRSAKRASTSSSRSSGGKLRQLAVLKPAHVLRQMDGVEGRGVSGLVKGLWPVSARAVVRT